MPRASQSLAAVIACQRVPRALIDSVRHSIPLGMTRIFDMDDRARLRERFFGASLTVLARL